MREADVRIGECRVRRVCGVDPFEDDVVIERADKYIFVSDQLLENLDERFAHYGDGILTLHGRDGDVSYGLSQHDPYLQRFLGTRAED